MKEIKYCENCGLMISKIENSVYFSHISIRYCHNCAKKIEREKTAARVAALRKRKKIVTVQDFSLQGHKTHCLQRH